METNWIIVRVQKDGRIAVPKNLRNHYGIKPGDLVDIKIRKEEHVEQPSKETSDNPCA